MSNEMHHGGCLCGAARYTTRGPTDLTGVCHCRYCQLRSGSAFGTLAYFDEENVQLLNGNMKDYKFISESGYSWHNQFCDECGVTLFMRLEVFPQKVGIAAGTFDPPSFWFNLKNEVFTRSKAHFVGAIGAEHCEETFFSHKPVNPDDGRLRG
jgi:hypothetical protein